MANYTLFIGLSLLISLADLVNDVYSFSWIQRYNVYSFLCIISDLGLCELLLVVYLHN
ncbi:hypothetical protein MtrunA17_Chr8g0387021 [Medicago truncatula]|uniref:Transmembrane protein n=1 Tax=Medicago truncatula TaxID=3880 RepID=A0A396GQD2_MEDTR|nr:hypothetical protein MtrunA17_Chr8g0387021 [Medicago truncatula]